MTERGQQLTKDNSCRVVGEEPLVGGLGFKRLRGSMSLRSFGVRQIRQTTPTPLVRHDRRHERGAEALGEGEGIGPLVVYSISGATDSADKLSASDPTPPCPIKRLTLQRVVLACLIIEGDRPVQRLEERRENLPRVSHAGDLVKTPYGPLVASKQNVERDDVRDVRPHETQRPITGLGQRS